jgi:hypothetical protein
MTVKEEEKVLEKYWELLKEGEKVTSNNIKKLDSEKVQSMKEFKKEFEEVAYDKNTFKYTHKKMIISGDIVEIYEYEKPIYYGYKDERKTGRKSVKPVIDRETGEVLDRMAVDTIQKVDGQEGLEKLREIIGKSKSENRAKTLYRAKQTVLRTANANSKELDKFLTLTFRDHVTDITEANKDFTNFVKRMRRWLKKNGKPDFKYICVIEFTKQGRVHYHLLCNLPYIKSEIIEKIWGQGFIKILRKRIDRVDNIGAYITKYMSKSLGDERLEGRKCFFKSQNLEEPIEDMLEARIEEKIKKIPEGCQTYEGEYDSEHLGNVRYKQFNLSSQYQKNKQSQK